MFNNSISITVSDDDSDELAGKIRARVRRKRKKFGPRSKVELTRRVLRQLLKWWPFVLFLPAAGLLLFEASRIGGRPSLLKSSKPLNVKKPLPANLDRVDPVTHVVHGVREPCLKLPPPEELEHLNIPERSESTSTVKRVVYLTESDTSYVERNYNVSQQHQEGTRFNLFTGNQTFEQREQSFKVGETAAVHCGFYSENGGFKISDEDKHYMQTCQVVVSTCAFGGGDDLYQPIGMSQISIQKVCYVAFWDEITLAAQEAEGHKVGEKRYIGKWRIVVVKDLPFRDQRLNGKIPKLLPRLP